MEERQEEKKPIDHIVRHPSLFNKILDAIADGKFYGGGPLYGFAYEADYWQYEFQELWLD